MGLIYAQKNSKQKIITPEERVQLNLSKPHSSSSKIGLTSIRLEDYRNQPQNDLCLPPLDHHLLVFNYQPAGVLFFSYGLNSFEDTLNPYDINYLPAFFENRWRSKTKTSIPHFFIVALQHSFLAQLALSTNDLDIETCEFLGRFKLRDCHLQGIADLLLTELLKDNPNGPLYIESLGTALGMYLISNHTNRRPVAKRTAGRLSRHQLKETIDYMHDRFSDKLSIQELAENVAMSPYHFIRLFRNTMGMPPFKYLIQIRLEQTKNMLLSNPHQSLSFIAQEVGFTDHSHMSRHFRERFGLTPSQFKARIL